MILEGIVTTMAPDGTVNVAPMGPIVPEDDPANWRQFVLRPFQTSRTFANLRQLPQGVLHVTDDVLLFAQATLGNAEVATVPAEVVQGRRLTDCCRYHEFEIVDWDTTGERTSLTAAIVRTVHVRDFFGFNRAKTAVIEAAILVSRLHLLPIEQIDLEMRRLRTMVEKTAGSREQAAFQLLEERVRQGIGNRE